ncbi:MAG: DUF4097 family beta strand repeat-containing protein [Acidobacteriota bacterium]
MSTLQLRNLLLGAALFGAATLPAQAATVHKVVSGVYPLAANGTLDLSNVNGSITLEAWDRPEVEVRADKIVKSPSEDEANRTLDQVKVIVDAKPNRVKVEAQFPHGHSGLFSWLSGRAVESIKVEFHVRIPREADLRIDNVNGGITLQGGKGDLRLTTVNGGVSATDTDGTLKLESTNGAIEAHHTRGTLEASTVNGRIEAELADLAGKSSLESTNGGITLRLPASVRANLSASTTNGGVSCDLDVAGAKKRNRIEGTLNGGGPEIEIDTVNGAVSIVELGGK